MKKNLHILFILLLIQGGLFAQTVSPKRGFGGPLNGISDLAAVENCAWYYNWSQEPGSSVINSVKNYIDYTPMAWGASYDETALREYLTNHPEIEYLLGFNEPNFLEQANIGPVAAAEMWPQLQSIADDFNLKLVSPALNFCYSGGAVIENGIEYTDPIQYLDDFFAALPEDSRVDYVAIHGYFDNTGALPWYIGLYDKYDRPLWLTEFNHSASDVTELSQQNYMVEALDYLENEPKVFRYAWFLVRSTQDNTNILANDGTLGTLTDLGLIFTNMSSYDEDYYHDVNNIIEAEHYVDMSGVHLTTVEDESGILAAHDFDADDWMDYNVEVETAGTYSLSIRITSVWESSFSIYEGDNLLGTFDTPNTEGLEAWETYDLGGAIELSEGQHTLRIVTNYSGWKLNWWQLTLDIPAAIDDETSCSKIQVYPTLFDQSNRDLHIDSDFDINSIQIMSICGNISLSMTNQGTSATVHLESLHPGIYIVVISGEQGSYSTKIVVK